MIFVNENSLVVGDDASCNCGRFEKSNSRIWKGIDTLDNTRYPFQIFLVINWKSWDPTQHFTCGGVLITWKHVVTAAHCIIYWPWNRKSDDVYGVALAGIYRFEDILFATSIYNISNVRNSQKNFFTAKDVKIHPGDMLIIY